VAPKEAIPRMMTQPLADLRTAIKEKDAQAFTRRSTRSQPGATTATRRRTSDSIASNGPHRTRRSFYRRTLEVYAPRDWTPTTSTSRVRRDRRAGAPIASVGALPDPLGCGVESLARAGE
jgi:hypothetical protein